MKKTILAIFLCLSMIAVFFVGCKKQDSATTDVKPNNQAEKSEEKNDDKNEESKDSQGF